MKIRGNIPVSTEEILDALSYIQSIGDLFESIKKYLPQNLEVLKTDSCFFSIWYKFAVILQSLTKSRNIFNKE